MALRPIVDPNGKFPKWVRDLKGKSGVYRFASIVHPEQTFYVGSSRKNRLYGTATRHVQTWDRSGAGPMTGYVFDRRDVLMEVAITEEGQAALDLEKKWIAKFDPLFNEGKVLHLETEQDDDFLPDLDDFIPF